MTIICLDSGIKHYSEIISSKIIWNLSDRADCQNDSYKLSSRLPQHLNITIPPDLSTKEKFSTRQGGGGGGGENVKINSYKYLMCVLQGVSCR